jgi:hypothetical protein
MPRITDLLYRTVGAPCGPSSVPAMALAHIAADSPVSSPRPPGQSRAGDDVRAHEIDYMMAINTGAPLYVQVKENFPEVVAVNAMYTHGLVVIVSTSAGSAGSLGPSACG